MSDILTFGPISGAYFNPAVSLALAPRTCTKVENVDTHAYKNSTCGPPIVSIISMNEFRTDDLFAQVSSVTTELRRVFISRYFLATFNGIVRYGPLRGFKLDSDPSWGPGDLAPKLFGLYEQEILNLLIEKRSKHKVLVNLGAGDGYYGVGLVATGFFERSICFETTEKGREAIKRTAQKNGVGEKIKIESTAGPDFQAIVAKLGIEANDCFILCDVEGAEFSIFSSPCLTGLRGADIIIELHGYMQAKGDEMEQRLIQDSRQLFHTAIVKTSARDLSLFPELDAISDTDRWLICSEGRPKVMSWLILSSK